MTIRLEQAERAARLKKWPMRLLQQCGFRNIREKVKFPCGVEVNFEAFDQLGQKWLFDVSGAFSVTQRPGLRRTDTLWKALGRASVLHSSGEAAPLVLLTTDQPAPNSAGHKALKAVTGPAQPVYDVIGMLDPTTYSVSPNWPQPLQRDDLAALLGGLPAEGLALGEADNAVHDERDQGQDEHDGEGVAIGELVGRGDEPLAEAAAG